MLSSDSTRRSSSITCSATVSAPIAGPAPRAWPASAKTSTSNQRTPIPATRRRRSVGSSRTAASPTTPARIEASVPFPLCSSSTAPTRVTGGSRPGAAARSASTARVAMARPDFMSPAPRPVIQPSRTWGAKGGRRPQPLVPGRHHVEVAVQEQAAAAVRAQPADDDGAPRVGAGADARARIELDPVREGDAVDRHADPVELGGQEVLGTLLGPRHAGLPNEVLEERERPLRALVDGPVDGLLDRMVFRLGH